MSDRLPTSIGVGALLRLVNDSGGLAMVRAKGDPQSGAVLFLIEEGSSMRAMERGIGPDGRSTLVEVRRVESQPDSPPDSLDEFWHRRRARDPDLWVVELSVPAAERFIVETMPFD